MVDAVLRSWSIPPVATFALALTALTYLRGCWLLRRAGYPYLPAWRIGSFALGLFALWFALASPLDTFSGFVLTAHMLQHMVLMMVAPPLLLLGEPLIPMVRGMPRFAAREFAGPFLNYSAAGRIGLALSNPVVALLLMGAVMFVWHVPGPYELALRSGSWHQAEHGCFFLASCIFWWPVIQPWPSRAQWPRWAMVPYLMIADLQNTVLSAVLVFSDKVLYPSYATGPSLFGFTPQEDQAAAGTTMWIIGSLAFVVPAVVIAVRCLSSRPQRNEISSFGKHKVSAVDEPLTDSSRLQFGRRWLPARFTRKSLEAISFAVLFVAVGSCLAWLFSFASTDTDDQTLRFSQQTGPFAVGVFASPGDLPTGPANFAILVQDRITHEVLLDTLVDLTARTSDPRAASSTISATREDSQNKLLQSAELNLSTVGNWSLDISVRRGSQRADLSLPLNVVVADAGAGNRWLYLGILVFFAILLFAYIWRNACHGWARGIRAEFECPRVAQQGNARELEVEK
jgi:cytochrome c oxidase assembly factor CtaG